MPDPKTFKQHFENKHPKEPMPEDLKDVWRKVVFWHITVIQHLAIHDL